MGTRTEAATLAQGDGQRHSGDTESGWTWALVLGVELTGVWSWFAVRNEGAQSCGSLRFMLDSWADNGAFAEIRSRLSGR